MENAAAALDAFIARWDAAGGSERATYQLLRERALRTAQRPEARPGVRRHAGQRLRIRAAGDIPPRRRQCDGFIDRYRRGAFVLEAKKLRRVEGKGFDDAILRARGQAEQHARALPAAEGRPPFLVVVDVGNVIELYAEFTRSGATYVPFPDPRSHQGAHDPRPGARQCAQGTARRARHRGLRGPAEGPRHRGHWACFADATNLARRLASATAQGSAQLQCYGSFYGAPFRLPETAPRSTGRVWPDQQAGVMVRLLHGHGGDVKLASVFPFFRKGVEHEIEIQRIVPWANEIEAQLEATVGIMSVKFFDIHYPEHRAFYEAGRRYQFILLGLAYALRPATNERIVPKEPKVVKALRSLEADTGAPPSAADQIEIATKDMAVLLPMPDGERDDYGFRGRVKTVAETAVFGQKLWSARVTVARVGEHFDQDFDLEIHATEVALDGNPPPLPGDDVKGSLWLQGYLWQPCEMAE